MIHRLARDDGRVIHNRWDPRLPPVLRIAPGDEVVVECRSGDDGQLAATSGAADVDRLDLRRLHALSGPIEIEGAEPGDVLVVHVLELELPAWGFTMARPGAGLLRGEPTWYRAFVLDPAKASTAFAPGIAVPLAPFLGVMGVAPATGPCSTIEPGLHGGNLDCRDTVAGTVLRLPIQVAGALFSCGDGHAAQGDGEVCVTALECALTCRLRFELERGRALPGPLLETPDAWMTLASAPTVEDAARAAVEAMLALICERTSLDRAAAYALASLAVDVRINQLVNGTQMGVRAVLAKSVLGDAGQTAVNADLLA